MLKICRWGTNSSVGATAGRSPRDKRARNAAFQLHLLWRTPPKDNDTKIPSQRFWDEEWREREKEHQTHREYIR